MNELRKRKYIRLRNYDYSQNGVYFITICVSDRRCLLTTITECSDPNAEPTVILTEIGKEIEEIIEYIENENNGINIQKYIIMPNHVHMIILISSYDKMEAVEHVGSNLQSIIGRIKSFTTKRWNDICSTKYKTLWQRSFYDHIIRNEQDYLAIWKYIDENPAKWYEDEYYQK